MILLIMRVPNWHPNIYILLITYKYSSQHKEDYIMADTSKIAEMYNGLTDEHIEHLKQIVTTRQQLNIHKGSNCDILLGGLIKAIKDGTIIADKLGDDVVKTLNNATISLKEAKCHDLLKSINEKQKIKCFIIIDDGTNKDHVEWDVSKVTFKDIFDQVVKRFNVTPLMVREKLKPVLKSTICNNTSQLLNKWLTQTEEEKKEKNISIATITRIVSDVVGYQIWSEWRP